MKLTLIALTIFIQSTMASANQVYFSKERMQNFACEVAGEIKKSYPNKTLRDLRMEILNILQDEISPWVNAYPIPAGFALPKKIAKLTGMQGFPMSRSEYYLQNAFILYGNPNRELKEHSENYFASFIHLARSKQVDYLNHKTGKFSLKDDSNLVQQIEDHLPYVADYAFPYQDENGLPIKQIKDGVKEKNLYKLAIGIPTHPKYEEFVLESQKYNHFSSPLFMWLLKQDRYSVSPEKLFQKALEIYGDPIVALGVIPWIFSGDALTVDRGTSSVVSFNAEKLIEGDDIPGLQYHFWGYLTQGIIGNKTRVGALAYTYEVLYQHDKQDWTIDSLSLETSDLIRSVFNNPKKCK